MTYTCGSKDCGEIGRSAVGHEWLICAHLPHITPHLPLIQLLQLWPCGYKHCIYSSLYFPISEGEFRVWRVVDEGLGYLSLWVPEIFFNFSYPKEPEFGNGISKKCPEYQEFRLQCKRTKNTNKLIPILITQHIMYRMK